MRSDYICGEKNKDLVRVWIWIFLAVENMENTLWEMYSQYAQFYLDNRWHLEKWHRVLTDVFYILLVPNLSLSGRWTRALSRSLSSSILKAWVTQFHSTHNIQFRRQKGAKITFRPYSPSAINLLYSWTQIHVLHFLSDTLTRSQSTLLEQKEYSDLKNSIIYEPPYHQIVIRLACTKETNIWIFQSHEVEAVHIQVRPG